ncbi:MAG: hypothetical protein ACOZHQ_04625 [Thermodesulfobacteriota bacterium]
MTGKAINQELSIATQLAGHLAELRRLGVARVDLVEKGAEHPALAANIRAEAVRVA